MGVGYLSVGLNAVFIFIFEYTVPIKSLPFGEIILLDEKLKREKRKVII